MLPYVLRAAIQFMLLRPDASTHQETKPAFIRRGTILHLTNPEGI
jgi:hypothetical protein